MSIFDEIDSDLEKERKQDPTIGQRDTSREDYESRIKETLAKTKKCLDKLDNKISKFNVHIKVEQFTSYDQFITRDDFNGRTELEYQSFVNKKSWKKFVGFKINILIGTDGIGYRHVFEHNTLSEVYSSEFFMKTVSNYLSNTATD